MLVSTPPHGSPSAGHPQPDVRRLARLVAQELRIDPAGASAAAPEPADELRRTRDRLDGILQVITDGVTVHDFTGRVVYANEAAALLLGTRSPADAEAFDAQGQRVPSDLRPERQAVDGVFPPE